MKENRHKLLSFIILFIPFFNILCSLFFKGSKTILYINTFFKLFIILYFLIYILFITGSKYKYNIVKYLKILFIYLILYFVFKPSLISFKYLFDELTNILKYLFIPIIYCGLITMFDDTYISKNKLNKIYFLTFLIYIILYIIPSFINLVLKLDYSISSLPSSVESIIILLLPYMYVTIKDDEKYKYLLVLLGIIIICSSNNLTSIIAILIISLIFIIKNILVNKKIFIRSVIYPSLIIIITLLLSFNNTSMFKNTINTYNDNVLNISLTNDIYKDNFNYKTVLFGIGFSNTFARSINIKSDFLTMYYHLGIFSLILVFIPFIFTLFKTIKYIKYNSFTSRINFYISVIILSIIISFLDGNILLDACISIYVVLFMIELLNEINFFEKDKLDNNKVSILALHLGYGGVENATVNLANMLSSKYNVEIISLYKTVDSIPYKLNNKVKVRYITNKKPRRKELFESIKKLNIIKSISIGLESIILLYKKSIYIRRYIISCDSKIIISTRIYFSNILNKYGRADTKKYGIEHDYFVDYNYIAKVKKSINNLDGYILVSKDAYNLYKTIMPKYNLFYIPNMLDKNYNIISDLNSKRIVCTGRLSKEKGMYDLLQVFNIVHKLDNSIVLDIFGDGPERNIMEKYILDNNLESSVTMHGFKSMDEIVKTYKVSSLYVMCSYRESFGLSPLEANSLGIPAICFDSATGVLDIIEDGKNGFIIKNRDFNEMANKIIEYINMKDKSKMQKYSLEVANKFSCKNISKLWFNLLDEYAVSAQSAANSSDSFSS